MSPDGGNGLRRTSSLVLSSPTKSSAPGRRPGKGAVEVEVARDSEEGNKKKPRAFEGEIIDLFSDSDDDIEPSRSTTQKKTVSVDRRSDPFLDSPRKLARTPSKLSKATVQESESEESDAQPHYTPKAGKALWTRRTVISDSEDESDIGARTEITEGSGIERIDDKDDGAILVLDDPPSSRKPAARAGASPSKPKPKPKRPPVAPVVHSTSSGGQIIIADPSPVQTPVLARPKGIPGTQAKLPDFFALGGKAREKGNARDNIEAGMIAATSSTPAIPVTPACAKSSAKRKTKKALQQEKQAHLAAYAQALFDELNVSVFKNRLPKQTPLVWNNRLLATAGRAKWHRNGQGVETTCIELATKVLDCEERIRNTLSHEMCHLACWVINCNPKENHGRVWQGWVDEVMEKRPDIAISTKHSYDIAYKFEWQCQTATCKKIYGRHSNSIDTTKSICGVCKVGELVPLFQTRARKTKAASKMAADKTLDSPVLSARRPTGTGTPNPSRLKTVQHDGAILVTSDSGTEHEAVSGSDTDTDDCVVVVEPKGCSQSTIRIRSSDVDDSHKENNANTKGGVHTDDVRKLVTHMSIIDLTDE